MTRLEPAHVPPEEVDLQIETMLQQWKDGNPVLREAIPHNDVCAAQSVIRNMIIEDHKDARIYLNDVYQVAKYPARGGVIHLSIKRIDREPITDWRDLQDIKNQLVGEENEALQLFPRESRVVDMANQYHLWVYADPRYTIPVGWFKGAKNDDSIGKWKQRPRTA